jgi:hypothetical protein
MCSRFNLARLIVNFAPGQRHLTAHRSGPVARGLDGSNFRKCNFSNEYTPHHGVILTLGCETKDYTGFLFRCYSRPFTSRPGIVRPAASLSIFLGDGQLAVEVVARGAVRPTNP